MIFGPGTNECGGVRSRVVSALGDDLTAFIGRVEELEVLRAALGSVASGGGQVVLIEGEAGIGKTRLLEQACDVARSSGVEVLEGWCEETGWAPFAALTRALRITDAPEDHDIARIAELLASDAVVAPSASGATPTVQFRLVEALGALVERRAADGPFVLALEDIHWADASTLAGLRSIARRIATLPVAIVATYRSGHTSALLHALIDDLARHRAIHIRLGPLDDDAVSDLVVAVLGAEPGEAVLARVTGAAGNPLFVTEYVRAVVEDGGAGERDVGTPHGFRRTVLRRLASLPETTNDLLRLASLLGTAFSPADLARAAGRSLVELAPALQHALVRGVLENRGSELAFRHALVRDAVYEDIPESVRRHLHREVGLALADAGASPLVVAHHLGASAEVGDVEAARWLRQAARDAASRAPAVAVELLERARDLLPETARDRDALLAELVIALAWAGRLAEAEALATTILASRPDPAVAGALRCGLVYALTWQGRPHEALRIADVDPANDLSDRDAVLLRAEAAVAKLFSFDLHGAAHLATEAIVEAEAVRHDLALCHALTAGAWTATFAGRPHDAVALALRAVDVAQASEGAEPYLAHPRFFPGMPLMYVDRLDEAEAMLQSGRRRAEDAGLAWSLPLYHAHLGIRRYIAGELDEAEAELEATLAVADEVAHHLPIVAAAASWLTAIRLHRNDLGGAEATVAAAMRRIAETGPQLGMGLLNWARAQLLEARGAADDAIALLQMAWDLYTAGGPVTDPWSAMAFVRISVAAGETDRAKDVLPVIDEQAAVTATPFMRAQALRCRGLVEADAELLLGAVEEYRRCPRPLELAAGCADAGIHVGRAGRIEDAAALLDEAVDVFDRAGAVRDAVRARAQLRGLGVVRGSRKTPRPRAATGWASLTSTELRVLDLVAQRLSNPELAERLFISRHTVESHLKHIYRKLGVSSRVELAAMAGRARSPG